MLVKEKARTMAPRPRWHSPRQRSSRAPLGPRPDMPLRLSDQPRDPDAEATLLESDGEGMLGLCVWRRLKEFFFIFKRTLGSSNKFTCVGRSAGDQTQTLTSELRSVTIMHQALHRWVPQVLRSAPWCAPQCSERVQELCQHKAEKLHTPSHQTRLI